MAKALQNGRYTEGKSPELAGERGWICANASGRADMAHVLLSFWNYMGLPDKTVGKSKIGGAFGPFYRWERKKR